jgi:ATP-dependent Clp protease adapter protein ClpS
MTECHLTDSTSQALPRPAHTIPALAAHRVILHKDDSHQMHYVAQTLIRVVGTLNQNRAEYIALKAFTMGSAIVVECPKEIAEHYHEQLTAYGLVVTIEAVQ